MHTDAGLSGLGEATVGEVAPLQAAVAHLDAALRGADATRMAQHTAVLPRQSARGGLVQAAARSAVEQALWDLNGKALGVPVHRLLGGAVRERIPLYANLNRGLTDRSPAAHAAAQAGFSAVKCAPFDAVTPGDAARPEGRRRIEAGL